MINRDLPCNSKKVVFIIKRSTCKQIYRECIYTSNNTTSLQKRNIKLQVTRERHISKHLNEFRRVDLKNAHIPD